MENIITYPIPQNKKGWKEEYRDLLITAKNLIRGEEPKLIILTGGGSRMNFTRDLCEDIFPHAETNPDKEPSFCVAKGLAGYGRWRHRVNEFYQSIRALSQSQEIKAKLHSHGVNYYRELNSILYKNGFKILNTVLHQARDGTIKSKDIKDIDNFFEIKIKEWLNSREGLKEQEGLRKNIYSNIINEVQPVLNEHIRKIEKEYGIEKSSLVLDLETDNFDLSDKREKDPIDNLVENIILFFIEKLDNLIPVKYRKWLPPQLIDAGTGIFDKLLSGFDAVFGATKIIGSLEKAPDRFLKQFNDKIIFQLTAILEEKAKNVEKELDLHSSN